MIKNLLEAVVHTAAEELKGERRPLRWCLQKVA